MIKFGDSWLDESKIVETFNQINKEAKRRAIAYLEYCAKGCWYYPFVLSPVQEADIFITRYYEGLAHDDTTTYVHAALDGKPCRLIAARAYYEYLKFG